MSAILSKGIAQLQVEGDLTVGANKERWVAPVSGTLVYATAGLKTAPTGAALQFNVKVNSNTVWSASMAINSTTATAEVTPTKFAAGDVISVSVTQIGSSVAGAGLEVNLAFDGASSDAGPVAYLDFYGNVG
jgi:hypothetical protein